jgi:hypothetical protein
MTPEVGDRFEVEHEFEYGKLRFQLDCPRCGAEVALTNPWITVACACGTAYALVCYAVVREVGTKP